MTPKVKPIKKGLNSGLNMRNRKISMILNFNSRRDSSAMQYIGDQRTSTKFVGSSLVGR